MACCINIVKQAQHDKRMTPFWLGELFVVGGGIWSNGDTLYALNILFKLYCKKRACNAHQIWCATFVSSEHLIWREVTPNFWCLFYAKLGVLSH